MSYQDQGLFSSAVEQLIRNEQVVGSNPMRGSKRALCAKRVVKRWKGGKVERNISFTLYLFTLYFFTFSCCTNPPAPPAEVEELYAPRHATAFNLERDGEHKILHVCNPWQGAVDVRFDYRLVPREDTAALSASLMNIPIPLERVVCLSTTHLAYIEALGETSTVVGVSGTGYVYNPTVRAAIAAGAVKDVGYEMGMSYETVAMLRPDVVFAYGVSGEMSRVADKLNSLGIRVVFLGDYLEDSPLGKAEYIMAIAAFYNKEAEALAFFDAVADDYHAAKALTDTLSVRPKVMLNAPWRSAWYISGENNYISRLIYDAGGKVLGAKPESRDSSPVSLEQAYLYAMDADFWLHPNAMRNLRELKNSDPRFGEVPAVRQHRVFNNSLRRTPEGGSDFWESGVVLPHIILRDLISILHPDLLPNHRLVYYEQLD